MQDISYHKAMDYDVIVIGAGIVGLSATDWFNLRGKKVLCLEQGKIGDGQSGGLVRIFRLDHENPDTVKLAQQARPKWLELEQRFKDDLFIPTGKLSFNPSLARQAQSSQAKLSSAQWQQLLPTHQQIKTAASWQSDAGVLMADKILSHLAKANQASIKHETVETISSYRDHVTITTDKSTYTGSKLLIAAGADTSQLASQVGLNIPVNLRWHLRLTFAIGKTPKQLLPAISDSTNIYCEQVYGCAADKQHYVLGLASPQANLAKYDDIELEKLRQRLKIYAKKAMPDLQAQVVGRRLCLSSTLAGSGEDDFAIYNQDQVYALAGGNLFKFGSIWGEYIGRKILS